MSQHEIFKKKKDTYSNNLILAGVDDSDGLVLAGGADEAPVAVPAHIVNDVRVPVLQGDHSLCCAHVPDDDLVVTTWRQSEGKVSRTAAQVTLTTGYMQEC